jgi:hypothetical protein
MKTYALIAVHLIIASLLLVMACSSPVKNKIQGEWTSKDGTTKLKITDKEFAMDENGTISEEYFIKNDTIYTSFQGNQPYTKFAIQKLETDKLTLVDPDSKQLEFLR